MKVKLQSLCLLNGCRPYIWKWCLIYTNHGVLYRERIKEVVALCLWRDNPPVSLVTAFVEIVEIVCISKMSSTLKVMNPAHSPPPDPLRCSLHMVSMYSP